MSAIDHRARRHIGPAAVVLAYFVAAGVTLALGVPRGGWLALHMVLLGAATNAIVVWSEHFAAALLHSRPSSQRLATSRLVVLNVAIVAVLAGVYDARTWLVGLGAGLLALVTLAHAADLTRRIRHALPSRLGDTVWFYVAAAAALVAAAGLGMLLGGAAAGSAEAFRAIRLAHAHLAVLGWIGLAVVGTLFTLWPTVLRTRMVTGLNRAARWSFLLTVVGLVLASAGLLARNRPLAVLGLAGYAAGLAVALEVFVRTLRQRRPHNAASWMLTAGMAWLVVAVAADLTALATTPTVVDLDTRIGPLVPVVAVGFGLQVLTGSLTYLLPSVWGRGPHGNRRLTGLLEVAWPVRVLALNLGVAVVALGPSTGWLSSAGEVLIALALGSFAVLAVAALIWKLGPGRVPT